MENLGQPAWFGQYRLTSRIATGGMAEVYLGRHIAEDGRFGPLVAVKRLLPHLVKDSQIVRMFLNEARITAQISHPNVVRVLDLGHESGEPYIAMELLDGYTLAELRRKSADEGRRVPLGITLRVLTDACRGLDAAHGAKDEEGKPLGLVHRDFTPDNIHVGATGEVKVIDFGVAKTQAWGVGTEPGTLKGKFFYMSPEMILARPLDHRADLFAAGVMLYEDLCGRRPFTGKSVDEVVLRIAEGTPKPPRAFDPSVPEALEVICLKALEREPDRRFPSLQEFIHAIESVGGMARVASREEVAEFMAANFPPEKDSKRQTLRRARAADPSQPGLGQFDPGVSAERPQASQQPSSQPPSRPLGDAPFDLPLVSATDINPVMQVPLGEPPLEVEEADLQGSQPTTLPTTLPPRTLPPLPEERRSNAPKLVLGGVLVAALGAGAFFALRGAGAGLAPAEALAQAQKAEPGARAKLVGGLAKNPAATDAQLELAGKLLLEAGADEALLDFTEDWTRRSPKDIRPRLFEAQAAAALRKGKRAEAAIAAAQELDPKDVRVDLALADLRERQGDLAGVTEALARVLRRSPDSVAVKRRYGILLSQANRLDEAAAVLEQVLARGFDARLGAELGFVEFRRKKVAEAEALLRKALKRDAQVMEAHYYLGAVLYQKGEVAQARAAYLEADKLAGDDSRPLTALCEIDAQQNSPQLEDTRKLLQTRFPKEASALIARCATPPAPREPAP